MVMAMVMGYGMVINDSVTDLLGQANGLLGRFIQIKEPNFRYLGLETMGRLARIPQTAEEKEASIKRHQAVIQQLLKDPDVSIRKRALDLLYDMCDSGNAQVHHIISPHHLCLPSPSFTDSVMNGWI
jgi:hypothetical protein